MATLLVWLDGPRSTPQSSWVAQIGYALVDDGRTGIAIQFKNRFGAFYPFTSEDLYLSLRRARSKGRWVHRHVYVEPYEELSG